MPKFNEYGLELIKSFESLHLSAYQDSAGIWTIGYGHTSDKAFSVSPNSVITAGKAEELLRIDIGEAEQFTRPINIEGLTDNQYSALVSIAFNSGAFKHKNKMGKWVNGKIVALINEGKVKEAGDHILTYKITAGGQQLKGLEYRRRAEWLLWNLAPETQILAEEWIKQIRNDIYIRKIYG